jgi:NAD(P)-dependent dehydrogenase (short-subunit alcohol dehydrogenase family)
MSSLFDLQGRSAVVIGGTSGIGRALGLGLADADVVASARRSAQVDQVAAEIESKGRRILRVLSDVSDRDSLQKLYDAVVERFGKVEELVGAAVFLASDAASFVSGHILAVDGGFLASGVNQ